MVHIGLFLRDICLNNKTGHLSFVRESLQKHLYFQDGSLIFAKTNVAEERLGEILFRVGKISPEIFRSIPNLIQPDSMLGETLVKNKFISQKDLIDGLIAQMQAIGLSLFPFFDAQIVFRERERFFEEKLEQRLNLLQVIDQGVRSMRFHPFLKDLFEGKIPMAGRLEAIRFLNKEERLLLDVVDGEKAAATLALEAAWNPEEFWKSIYLFYCLDLIVLADAATKPHDEASRSRGAEDFQIRIKEVMDLRQKLPGLDDYQILGLSSRADAAEVKKAYFRLARRFHPDLFERQLAPDIRDQIEAVFDAITKAYRTLVSRETKGSVPVRTDSAVDEGEKDSSKNAEIRYRQGKTLFQRGRYEDAIGLLEEAVRLKDNKGDFYLLLAMTQSKFSAMSKKAERNFLLAAELEPWNPESLIGLGLLYKGEGLLARSRRLFEKALEIDPEHRVARLELKLLGGKPDKKKGLKGFFGKDFFSGKKK
jgi:tetratricopeptide (TPR) repeat protein